MKKFKFILALFAGIMSTMTAHAATTIQGAGATFPYPVYSQWAYQYQQFAGDQLNYQSIGSGGGIAQIKAKTVDFGASDAPLEEAELTESGLVQFPMIVGGVVPIVNIAQVSPGQLKLTPQVLADIYLGKINTWNDPAIVGLNPGVKLPQQAITAVYRSDGSGTTWVYTNYLQKVSTAWKEKVGFGKAVSWPVGVGGKGNEGVSAYVQKIPGSIGYVEYAYALQNKLAYTQLQNKAGQYVAPTIETFQSAASNADWKNTKGYAVVLTDQPGEKSWPITGASFILIHKDQPDLQKAQAMLKFFNWCLLHGSDMAEKLHYVPLPANVVAEIQNTWKMDVKAQNQAIAFETQP